GRDVLCSGAGTLLPVFVLKLYADDGATVLPEQALKLLANFSIKALHVRKIRRVVSPRRSLFQKPIREASIPHLPMCPWSHPGKYIHSVFPAKLHEVVEIALSRPIKLAFNFLVMNPKYVRRDDLDPTRLHFQNLFFPIPFWIAGKMELPHHREPRLPIKRQIPAIDLDFMAAGRLCAHLQIAAFGRKSWAARVNRNHAT